MVPVYLVSFRPVFESKNRQIIGVFVSHKEACRVFRSLPVDLDPSLVRLSLIPFKSEKISHQPIKCD